MQWWRLEDGGKEREMTMIRDEKLDDREKGEEDCGGLRGLGEVGREGGGGRLRRLG